MALQVCAVYQAPQTDAADALRQVLRQIAGFHTAVESNPEVFAVSSRRDLEKVGANGLGLLLAIEGVSSFGEDMWPLELVARLGVRVLGPTWNEQNAFAHGCDHDGGLTTLGRRLIDRVPTLGMVVDLAHASPQTVADVLDRVPDGAVFVSHASCRAIYDHRRNLSDAQLTAIAERGGVVCLMPHPLVVDPEPTDDRSLHRPHRPRGLGHRSRSGRARRRLSPADRTRDGRRSADVRRHRDRRDTRRARGAARLPSPVGGASRSRLLERGRRGGRRRQPPSLPRGESSPVAFMG